MHYTKITNASFLPDLLSDGDVWQCNLVTAKWVCDHGYGFYSDSAGTAATSPWDGAGEDVPAPQFESGLVSDLDTSEVVINFDGSLAVTDETGMTITADAAPIVVSNAAVAGDALTLTLAGPVAAGEAVLFSYDADTGNLLASGEGDTPVADLTDAVVTNTVT